MLTIIHAGPAHIPGTSTQRARAFEDLGHRVSRVLTSRPGEKVSSARQFYRRVRAKLGIPEERCAENRALLEEVERRKPHLVWIEKGLTVRPSTLARIRRVSPKTLLVFFSPDDMMNPINQSRYYLAGIPRYDLHVTTKTHNIPELYECGARRVLFMAKSSIRTRTGRWGSAQRPTGLRRRGGFCRGVRNGTGSQYGLSCRARHSGEDLGGFLGALQGSSPQFES